MSRQDQYYAFIRHTAEELCGRDFHAGIETADVENYMDEAQIQLNSLTNLAFLDAWTSFLDSLEP